MSSIVSFGDAKDLSRLDALDRGQYLGDQRKEILVGQILLVLKIPVSGDEDREPGSPCLCEQCAVLEPGLGLLLHRPDLVARKVPRELPWQLLIEENAHERSQPRGPPRGRPRLVP